MNFRTRLRRQLENLLESSTEEVTLDTGRSYAKDNFKNQKQKKKIRFK